MQGARARGKYSHVARISWSHVATTYRATASSSGAHSGKLSPGLSIIDEGEQHEERQQVAEALE